VVVPTAQASFARLLDVIDTPPCLPDGVTDLPDGPIGLDFEKITFGYAAAPMSCPT